VNYKKEKNLKSIKLSLVAVAVCSMVYAEEVTNLGKVEVVEKYTALSERRDSSIAKRIINGAELSQYGDINAFEILKRTPGVTIPIGKGTRSGPGKGYTVVMVDGESISIIGGHKGNPLEQISPDMIEKIEVMTNGSAENSAESMGGIVNIVLKKPKSEGLTIAKISLGADGSSPMKSVFLQREGKSGKLSYQFNLSGNDNKAKDTSSISQQGSTVSQENREDEINNKSTTFATKLIYTASDKDKYSYSGNFSKSSGEELSDSKSYRNNTSILNNQINSDNTSSRTMIFSSISGEHFITDEESFEWKIKLHQLTDRGENNSFASSSQTTSYLKDYSFNRMLGAEGVYSWMVQDHFIKSGIELGNAKQKDEVVHIENGVDTTTPADNINMSEDKVALFVQDEFNYSPTITITPGIRYEKLSRDYGATSDIDYFVGSFHFLNKLNKNENIRASVAQTVRLPRISQLTTSTNSTLSYNDINRPDVIGNPNLTEEKALSYELRFEHFFEDKGIASIGGFHREIEDKIENITYLDTTTNRYVQKPQNAGNGKLWGLEMELKKSLSYYITGVGIFANATFQDSSVTNDVTGEKRPIKQTSKLLYNLGLDQTLKEYKLTYGATYRYTGGYDDPVDNNGYSLTQKGYGTLDLYATKRIDKTFKFQLNLKNITSATTQTTSNFYNAGVLSKTQIDKEDSKPQILLSLEAKW
jgi:iron complex outermembrane receptor protein